MALRGDGVNGIRRSPEKKPSKMPSMACKEDECAESLGPHSLVWMLDAEVNNNDGELPADLLGKLAVLRAGEPTYELQTERQ